MIPNLKNFVEQFTGYHTQIGLPISRLSNLQDKSYAQSMYATSIGLALLAAENANEFIVENMDYVKENPTMTVDTAPQEENTDVSVGTQNTGWLKKIQSKIGTFLLDEATMKEFEDQ
jgi:hypothetical protein